MSILNWRVCKKCWRHYDIGTNYEICPECRNEGGEDGESKHT